MIMATQKFSIFLIYLLASSVLVTGKKSEKSSWSSYLWIGAGAVTAVVATPVLLGAAGFTATGIVAGSVGAKMMSAAAVANGGGVAAGGLVATLQSLGTGLGMAANTVTAVGGGYIANKLYADDED